MTRAEETLKDHTYRLLCSSATPFVQVWRCQQPGTLLESFDLLVTDDYITLSGDIDAVVLAFGQAHGGLAYLARQTEAFYLRRLADGSRDMELNFEQLRDAIYQHFYAVLEPDLSDVDCDDPVQARDWLPPDYDAEAWDRLVALIERQEACVVPPGWGDSVRNQSRFTALRERDVAALADYLRSTENLRDMPTVMAVLHVLDLAGLLETDAVYEHDVDAFEQLSSSVRYRVSLMAEAVRRIAAQAVTHV